MKFTENGKYVLSACLDSTLKLWNVKTGALERTLIGHLNNKFKITPIIIGERVVMGTEDGRIVIYDLDDGNSHSISVYEEDVCLNMALLPGNRLAVSGLKSGSTIKFVKID